MCQPKPAKNSYLHDPCMCKGLLNRPLDHICLLLEDNMERDYPRSEPVISHCINVSELNQAQLEIVETHLDRHMEFRGIKDRTQAAQSFIAEFGWLMREMFCRYGCRFNTYCLIATKLKDKKSFFDPFIKPDEERKQGRRF